MPSIDVKLGINTAGYKNGLKDARNETKRFKSESESAFSGLGGKIAILAGGITGAAVAAYAGAKSFVNFGAEIKDTAENAGTTSEQMQRLQAAFEASGGKAAKVTQGVANMTEAMSEALNENEETRASFERLGVSMDDLVTLADNPEEVLFKLADGFKNAADEGKALKDLNVILGGSFKNMRAGLRGGGEELRKLFNEAKVLAEEEVDALDDVDDALTSFGRKAKVTGGSIAAGLLGKGKKFELEDPQRAADRAAVEKKTEELKNTQRLEAQRAKEEIKARELREKDAAEAVKAQQEQAKVESTARGSISTRTRAAETRRRIRELLPVSVGPGHDAARNRAQLAGALAERSEQLREEALQTPDERREARREAGRRERASRKADRALRRELAGDAKASSESQKDGTAEAVKTGNEILDQMLQLQKERLTGTPR